MGVTDRFRVWLARGLVKAAGLPIVPPWLTASFLEPVFRNLVNEGYKANAAVFACVSALAFAFPEPPLMVWDAADDPLPAHPLRKLLRRPNPLMGEAELAAYTIVYLAIGGNAYWHKVRSAAGRVVELWPYHAGQISVVPAPAGWIAHYAYDPGGTGKTIPVPREDVVHFKWPAPDPHQPWQALPPLRAVARETDSDNELTRYLFALLKNDAVPRTALVLPPAVTLDDAQFNRLKAQWNQEHGGANRGGTAIVEGGAQIQRIGLDLKELAFDALHGVPEKRICGAFRTPMSVAGLGDDPTYANSEEAYKRWTQSTLAPLWVLTASEVDADLAPEFDGDVTVRHDLSRVKALREEVTAQWSRVQGAIAGGWLTVNEGRGELGFEDVAGGGVFLRGISVVPEAAGAKAFPARRRPSVKGVSARRQAALAVGQALQRTRRELAGRLEGAVDAYFAALAERVVARALKAWPVSAETKDLPDADDLLGPEDDRELETIVKRFYVELLSASWETWNMALGAEVAFDLTDPAVSEVLKGAGKRIRGIGDTTREAVRELLRYGDAQGWSVDRLVRGDEEHPGLRDLVAETYKHRARTIARTELGTAQETVARSRYAAGGVRKVLILDNGFDDSDPNCEWLGNGGKGSVRPIEWLDEDHPGEGPSGIKNPLQHPNCVRATAPYFDD